MSWVRRRLSVSMYSPYSRTFSGLVHPAEPQELAEDADRGERRAQLVRDVGDEVALHLREPHLARRGAQREARRRPRPPRRAAADRPRLNTKLRRAHVGRRRRGGCGCRARPVGEDEAQAAASPRPGAGCASRRRSRSRGRRRRAPSPPAARPRSSAKNLGSELPTAAAAPCSRSKRLIEDHPGEPDHLAGFVGDRVEEHAVLAVALVDLELRLRELAALLARIFQGAIATYTARISSDQGGA